MALQWYNTISKPLPLVPSNHGLLDYHSASPCLAELCWLFVLPPGVCFISLGWLCRQHCWTHPTAKDNRRMCMFANLASPPLPHLNRGIDSYLCSSVTWTFLYAMSQSKVNSTLTENQMYRKNTQMQTTVFKSQIPSHNSVKYKKNIFITN